MQMPLNGYWCVSVIVPLSMDRSVFLLVWILGTRMQHIKAMQGRGSEIPHVSAPGSARLARSSAVRSETGTWVADEGVVVDASCEVTRRTVVAAGDGIRQL